MSNIKEAIRRLAQDGRQTVSLVCKVDAVDKTARTVDCTPLDESAPLLGVNLQANQGSEFGIVTFPKVGSYVVVGFVADDSAGVVLLTDEIESVEVVISENTARILADKEGVRVLMGDDVNAKITDEGVAVSKGSAAVTVGSDCVTVKKGNNVKAEFTNNGIIFNGGSFGGMVKVEALTAKLNELIAAFNSHTHTLPSNAVAVAGSATSQNNPAPITVPAITSKHTSVSCGDYENDKVKH